MLTVEVTTSLKLTSPLPLTGHPAAVYLRSLAPRSRLTMQGSLKAIASLLTNGECDHLSLNWANLRYQHTSAVQAALLERQAPATAAKMMCALRRTLKEAKRLGLMSGDDYQAAIDLPSIKNNCKKLRGRALNQAEIKALMAVCENDTTTQGLRDAALIAILRGAGLRRAEAVKLQLKDFNQEAGSLQIIGGKGDKDRLVYLPESAIAIVNRWLEVRGFTPGALLCPIQKGGRIVIRSMSSQSVLLIVQKRALQAGVESFSPHDFRRTFCSDLLDAGVDIVTVQKLAGHASPVTTAKYDRRGEAVKRRAVQNLGF
ncbi:tyrosine-type recombinase/integrase [Crocosphaera sp. UHCC 0190]|uniref:tyrosine-type recombinase/integrase n=1 Tax=unclassified Crocosphaera TaxID=2623705 RepID=UPI002B2120EB|nr:MULTISPECIES: tyrosine-type recombinase/integrase [unclassified Crocosphaera]MEA5511942.1 tyrosine-type recombinase/integrase [Crocosphaera sp. UHCC 0190]MEA5536649.1 tyrosine-type recombinase/integrase [Crocosphaera sp. XPORK-15E]